MTVQESYKIGRRNGFVSSLIGLLIAQLIMTFLNSGYVGIADSFFWFIDFNYQVNLIIGVIITLSFGYFFGGIAGKEILIKNRNFIFIGICCGIATLIVTAFLSGWTGFFQEVISKIGTNYNTFEDYILKPFFLIFTFGIIPAILIGVWFGWQVKKTGKE